MDPIMRKRHTSGVEKTLISSKGRDGTPAVGSGVRWYADWIAASGGDGDLVVAHW